MKIAILTASYLPKVGGAEVFAHNISRQFADLGHTVDVHVPHDKFRALAPRFRELLRPLPPKFYGVARRVPFAGLYLAQRHLRRLQRREGYDVWLVVRTYPSGYVASCLQGAVPMVLRASGEDIQKSTELDYGVRLNRTEAARIERTVTTYDKVVAMTESVRKDFLDIGVREEAIVTVPNGVDVERFAKDRDVAQVRAELGWPNDRLLILTTGRNHRKKGFDLIPSIAQQLRGRGLQFSWHVVGRGVDAIAGEIRARGLEDCLFTHDQIGVTSSGDGDWRFPDRRLVMMYQAADVYAFPTFLENFALVLLEAMAAGAAVVTTDAPGCGDTFTAEVQGLQARAGDVDSFVHQMSRVLGDTALRARLVENAGRLVPAYSWANVARQYENVFRELVEAHRRSGWTQPAPSGSARSSP